MAKCTLCDGRDYSLSAPNRRRPEQQKNKKKINEFIIRKLPDVRFACDTDCQPHNISPLDELVLSRDSHSIVTARVQWPVNVDGVRALRPTHTMA